MSTDKLPEDPSKDEVEDIKDASSLSELFDKAFELFNNINKTEEPTNSSEVQCNIKRAMRMFEDATRLVSIVDMFSENENYEEVPTENLKYFLLPAFLGTLTTKICGVEDRTHLLNVAEIYFVDFLKRVVAYGLSNIEIPTPSTHPDDETAVEHVKSNAEKITEMVNRRNTKIQRFKEKKELEGRLEVMQKNMDNLNIDDEIKREYFITLIKLYVNQAIEELGPLDAERRLLEQMKTLGSPSSTATHKPKLPQAKLQPIIITRDELQKKVYGAGYPSLPVLTVQEFYDQKVKEGDWPDPSQRNQIGGKSLQDMANTSNQNEEKDLEQAEDESKIDQDDPEYLARQRAMDEYKDTHKRGWGNRANRS